MIFETANSSALSKFIPLSKQISYLPAAQSPLSADIVRVDGQKHTWLYDVGNGDYARENLQIALSETNKPLRIVCSHFHPDHIGNLSAWEDLPAWEQLYLGKNTYSYAKTGQIVTEDQWIEDGVTIHIFPFPSSHAKGSLGLEVIGDVCDAAFLCLGDALYPTTKQGVRCCNANILQEQIQLLQSLSAETILLSHKAPIAHEREKVLEKLLEIYAKRVKNNPYIICNEKGFEI